MGKETCHGSKLTLIQAPSPTLDGTEFQMSMPHEMFADCDLSPLCPARSFVNSAMVISEPTQHEVSRENSVTK